MEYETIRVAQEGSIATVTIHRPEKLNALSAKVIEDLTAAFGAMTGVRAAILTGAGDKAFVAGADISEMAELTAEQALHFARKGHALGALMEALPFPVIAAINGFALGGGTEIALCCDIIVASEKAKSASPKWASGSSRARRTLRLARRVGAGKARELVLIGHVIDAQEAKAIGLADRVVAPEALMGEVRAMAEKIAANAPVAVAHAKRVMHAGESLPMEVARELEVQAFALCFATEDQKSGMRTFVQSPKLPRVFSGR